jgi:predicted Zn-dependent peptidase
LTVAEVARARAQLKAGMVMGLESPTSRAERLARYMSIWGRVPPLSEAVGKIDAVTTQAVRDFAGRMTEGAAALALYGPIGDAPGLDALRARLAA